MLLLFKSCCREEQAVSHHPASLTPEIITQKTVLTKSLPGPLALASYWLTLTFLSNPLLIICVASWGRGSLGKILTYACLGPELHGVCHTSLLPSLLFCLLRQLKGCPIKRPRQSLYSTKESNTQTGDPPTSKSICCGKQIQLKTRHRKECVVMKDNHTA